MRRLEDRCALVTGAAGGIGRATALTLAQEGAALVCLDRSQDVSETAAAIAEAGGRAVALTGDAADEAFIAAAVDRAVTDFGALDILHANAGISGHWVGYASLDAAVWTEILRVNLIGTFLAAKHAARVMVPRGKGSIICTASVAGIRSGAGPMPYSASKAGVISLVQTMANELCNSGVRINAVCPGLIETGMTKPIYDMARQRGTQDRIGQLNPLGRGGEPEEIARVVAFLASDEASYINGQALPVDGGLTSSLPVMRR
jgi:NAD(P)-dependent dehydrogenase (short-subunit alcohol dehydrogenase family)